MNIPRIGGLAAAALISAGLLAGCGSSSDTAASGDTTAPVSTGEMVGGMATCDAASITDAAKAGEDQPVALAEPDAFKCADGWAYAFVNVGSGEEQVTVTKVFEAEGQFWIVKDRGDVCDGPGNQVPAAIYQDACQTN